MEQEIHLNQQRFEKQADNFIRTYILCRKIVSSSLFEKRKKTKNEFCETFPFDLLFQVAKLTDAVFMNKVHIESGIRVVNEQKLFL